MQRRWKFFNKDGKREPFLINAPLVIANPRRTKKKTMAKKRAKPRKNYFGAGALVNRRTKKRTHRRNPPAAGGMQIMGVPVPPLDRLLATTAGALGPELVEMMVDEFAPDFKTTSGGQTAVQIGSYALPPLVALMFFPKRVVGDVVLGELLNLTMVQGRKLIASMSGNPSSVAGYLPSLPAPNVSSNAQLAGYVRRPGINMRGYKTTPDRLALRYPNGNYRTNQF